MPRPPPPTRVRANASRRTLNGRTKGGAQKRKWFACEPILSCRAPLPDPLEGTWTVKGQVTTKWDSYSLDATTFENGGVRYFVWAQDEPGKVGTNIMIAKMVSPTSLTGEQVILSRPQYSWETQGGVVVNEGPSALVKNGSHQSPGQRRPRHARPGSPLEGGRHARFRHTRRRRTLPGAVGSAAVLESSSPGAPSRFS